MAGELGELEHHGRSAILRRGHFPAAGDAQLAATRRRRIHRLAAEEPPSPSSPPQPPVNTQDLGTTCVYQQSHPVSSVIQGI